MGDIWCYLALICPYFVEETGRNRLDDIMWTKRFCDFLQEKFVTEDKVKVFKESGYMEQSAHFGWQDKDKALFGLREGYKESADRLLEIALENGNNIKMLDTFIFPIMFLYRHSIEISLKHIYQRAFGKIPDGGHNLLALWDNVKKDVIDDMICSAEFLAQVKTYKNNFIKYSLDGIKLTEIRSMMKELQEANQRDKEVDPSVKQIDQNAEVWRYLMDNDDSLFFSYGHSVDYPQIKKSMGYIYEVLDFIYHIIDEYLSS